MKRQIEEDGSDGVEINEPRQSGFSIWWLLFRMPGIVILWIQYMFPSSGRVLVSARHKNSPVMEVLASLAFWGVVLYITYNLVFKGVGAPTS